MSIDGFTGTCPTCGQRDLRAVLANTPENVAAVTPFIERWYSKQPPWTEPEQAAQAILADLRARAGL